ncbi:MAG: AMP-binding protein [Anaerolineae bacterium]
MLSYASGVSDVPLLGQTIGENFDATVARFPDNEALVVRHQNVRYTYRQLSDAVNECARALLALGIKKGERLGIWAPNCAEWVITQYATSKIGVILVNINPAYRTSELDYVVRQSELCGLILAPRLKSSDYCKMLEELIPELAGQAAHARTIQSARFPVLRHLVVIEDAARPGFMNWRDLLALAPQVTAEHLGDMQRLQQFDDPINIQYTSGTTGFPKGATLTHHNILNNGYFVGERMRFTSRDRLCIPVPLYHCFGMVLGNLACTTHGATMIYPGETFEPLATLETVQAEKCTALHGVPSMFIAELNHPELGRFDFSSLRTGLMAGSPCPIEVMKEVTTRMHMTEVEIAYGMTETSPVSFQTEADSPLEKRVGTVGRAMPFVECKIVDPVSGMVAPRGIPGELCTRGYSIMLGYWNNREATAQAIDPARWMHTGDLATMDADGYVNIVGRIKDMIIRGGENIYPREIEEFLYTHPAVADVQVIGVPSRKYGEEVMAWVKVKPGAQATPDELRAFCQGKISHYKVPRYIKLVDGFPMTVTGKIQKYIMRQQSIEDLGLQGEIQATA